VLDTRTPREKGTLYRRYLRKKEAALLSQTKLDQKAWTASCYHSCLVNVNDTVGGQSRN